MTLLRHFIRIAILGCIVVFGLFACGSEDYFFEWRESNGEITITRYTGFWRNIRIPSTIDGKPVTSIGNAAFWEHPRLKSVIMPDSITSIGKMAFFGCTSLGSVEIPDSVTSIEDTAFYDCTSLTSITIPGGITSIGYRAFGSCTSLKSIPIYAKTPPLLYWPVFMNNHADRKIYVPADAVTAYREHENWSNYRDAIFPIE